LLKTSAAINPAGPPPITATVRGGREVFVADGLITVIPVDEEQIALSVRHYKPTALYIILNLRDIWR
jgi:hypothetical protein